MAHSAKSFKKRLETGKSWSLTYDNEKLQGLVEVWKYGEVFVLTWEECIAGQQYDESEYLKDERHEFNSLRELMNFIEEHGFEVSSFEP